MQKDSEGKWKKTVNLSKEECGKLALMLKEISEKKFHTHSFFF